jgi:hypothetical protein
MAHGFYGWGIYPMLRVMVQVIYLKDLDQETIEGPSLLVFVTIPCKHFGNLSDLPYFYETPWCHYIVRETKIV